MRKTFLYILSAAGLALTSCNYQHLLKSSDSQLKYDKAKEFYAKGDYMRTYTLLEDISAAYKGTAEGDEILYIIADSHFKNKDYMAAKNYYKAYTANYPQGAHRAECQYMIGLCHYKESPDAKLDQTDTYDAIEAYRTYMELFPMDGHTSDAAREMKEMEEKLAYKELLSARLYYRLGNYLGNNYRSAIIVAQNAVRDFPETEYLEDFAFIILKSKFMQAEKSVHEKKNERYRDAVDQYYVYASEFPEGKNKKEAEQIFNTSKKHINE